MFDPNVVLMGKPSMMSEGIVIELSTRLQRITSELTVEPIGVRLLRVLELDAVLVGKVPVENPIIGAIERVGKTSWGVAADAGKPCHAAPKVDTVGAV